MSRYLYNLRSAYKAKMEEMKAETNRLRKLELQGELEELNEIIGVVAQLNRYSGKK